LSARPADFGALGDVGDVALFGFAGILDFVLVVFPEERIDDPRLGEMVVVLFAGDSSSES
jgi:hypothetical protein